SRRRHRLTSPAGPRPPRRRPRLGQEDGGGEGRPAACSTIGPSHLVATAAAAASLRWYPSGRASSTPATVCVNLPLGHSSALRSPSRVPVAAIVRLIWSRAATRRSPSLFLV